MKIASILLLLVLAIPATLAAHPNHPEDMLEGELPRPFEADINLKQLNLVIDAPWRVQLRPGGPNYIPVLYFFPETKKKWRRIQVLRMRLFEPTPSGESLIWEDTHDSGPAFGQSRTFGFDGRKITGIDGFGLPTGSLDLVRSEAPPADGAVPWWVSEVNDENRGWHVILRVPVPAGTRALVSGRRVSSGSPVVAELTGQVDYKRLDEEDATVYTIRRKLFVELDSDGFPTFPGWRYYDTHVHTVAEYDTNTSITAVRKSYGGPIQMLKECAYAIGMIESPERAKHRLITTDHNVFYSDEELVKYGPTAKGAWEEPIQVEHPEFTPYFTDEKGRVHLRGQKEYENYLDHFGITTGSELTLHKRGGFLGLISGTLGSHLLSYSTRHFLGPFHGGRFFIYKNEPNPNPLDRVLAAIAGDPNFRRGFTYAAHPFSPEKLVQNLLLAWNEDQIQLALKGEFIRRDGRRDVDFVFKGFQGWNGKSSRHLATNTILPDRTLALLEDPTWHRDWIRGNPNWDDNLQYGLSRWMKYLSDSFAFAVTSAPDAKFVRKFYFSGGTDAHGDFNRDSGLLARGLTALPAQIMRFLKIFSMAENAFGKVRTYVDATGLAADAKETAEERALRAFGLGHSIVTDGPILSFVMDANANFSSHPDVLRWHSEAFFEDADGQIGGTGDMDGGRTMLLAENTGNVMFRYRWKSAPDFGGPLRQIEIYKIEAGLPPRLVERQRNTGPAQMIEPQGELDPDAPEDASGWRSERLGEAHRPGEPVETPITAPSAFVLGGFTERRSEPPYDFRCYTNPVWALPVRLSTRVARDRAAAGRLPPGSVEFTVRFPVSMDPRRVEMRLVPLDANGNSFGRGIALVPVEGAPRVRGWSKNVREGIANSEYTVANRDEAVDLASSLQDGHFCVYLKEPADLHGNVLNSVAWLVDLRQPPGE